MVDLREYLTTESEEAEHVAHTQKRRSGIVSRGGRVMGRGGGGDILTVPVELV